MPANIEIKAFVDDLAVVERKTRALADSPPEIVHQEDVFFSCAVGRLKLRIFDESRGELIWYRRADETGPNLSEYTISPTNDPAGLRTALAQALGETAVVRKGRCVYLVGQTRVHLDQVEGLGTFVELEVVLEEDQSEDEGVRIAEELMETLGLDRERLVECAYADLLAIQAV